MAMGYRRWPLLTRVFRPLVWCCAMWFGCMLVAEVTYALWNYNIGIWNLVTVLEALLIGSAFHYALDSARAAKWIRWVGAAYVVLAVAEATVVDGVWVTLRCTTLAETCGLVVLALLYFNQTLEQLRNVRLENEPMFVVSVAVLVYFAGTLVYFLAGSYFSITAMSFLSIVNHILSIGLNLCIARAIRLAAAQQLAATAPTQARNFQAA